MQQAPAVGQQVISYVGEFVLGGIALLCIAVAYWAIRELKQAHQNHVKALEKGSEQHVEMHKAYQSSNAQTVAALGRLTDTENTQTAAIQDNTKSLTRHDAEIRAIREEMQSLRRSVDSVIAEAVRRRRSSDRNPVIKGGD